MTGRFEIVGVTIVKPESSVFCDFWRTIDHRVNNFVSHFILAFSIPAGTIWHAPILLTGVGALMASETSTLARNSRAL